MKKLIFITLALSLILASAAFASQTRVLTMGDNSTVLVDNANIWNWASRLYDYPNLAIGEFGYNGYGGFGQFGVHWQFNEDNPWVLATYFDNMPSYTGFFGYPGGLGLPINRRIHALYARKMGTNKFGARVSLYGSSEKYEDTAATYYDESWHYYQGQVSLTADDNSWDISVTGGFGSWADKTDTSMYSEPDGFMDFAVLGRMFWNNGPNYQYVPHASFEYHKQGEDYYYNTTTTADDEIYKYTAFIADFGIGQVYTPSNNVEAVLDLGVMFESYKEEYTDVATSANNDQEKYDYITVPYFKLGLDAGVFSWMDVRFGATSYWTRFKDEYKETVGTYTSTYHENYASNDTYLGFGFHWGNLHVDTYTDPYLFLQGFNFISGNDSGDMNFQISAVYDMM